MGTNAQRLTEGKKVSVIFNLIAEGDFFPMVNIYITPKPPLIMKWLNYSCLLVWLFCPFMIADQMPIGLGVVGFFVILKIARTKHQTKISDIREEVLEAGI